ncbi:hypothetical protein CDL15_Pgr012258 [Punica granatum]|uniref:Uncharacterized protein n=1 Tax=Punica granatum TaxID=22663 RepID=A0A218WS44_PUNGR|nr:hypothetical protein CDL15_Pgr012258 [Punica granatum]
MNSSSCEETPNSSIEESSITVQSEGGMYRLRWWGNSSHCHSSATTVAPREADPVVRPLDKVSESSEIST